MSKNVIYLVVGGQDKIDENTKASIEPNLGKFDAMVYIKVNDDKRELYCDLKTEVNRIINDVNNFHYVFLLPNGAEVNNEAGNIFAEYQVDREDEVREVYMPFVLYTAGETTAVLNKHMWNSMISYMPGIMDLDLALKQIDSTLFGSFVPVDLFFNQEYYNRDLKYYQQYHVINNLTDGDNIIMGIPKILLTITDWDFKYEELSKEDKILNFNLAREKWKKTAETATSSEGVQSAE